MRDALLEVGIDPLMLAKKIKELLNAEKSVLQNGKIAFTLPDTEMINKGLTHALRVGVGGGYVDGNSQPPVQINFGFVNSPDVQAQIQKFEEELKKVL